MECYKTFFVQIFLLFRHRKSGPGMWKSSAKKVSKQGPSLPIQRSFKLFEKNVGWYKIDFFLTEIEWQIKWMNKLSDGCSKIILESFNTKLLVWKSKSVELSCWPPSIDALQNKRKKAWTENWSGLWFCSVKISIESTALCLHKCAAFAAASFYRSGVRWQRTDRALNQSLWRGRWWIATDKLQSTNCWFLHPYK